jgi:NAD(P)-dependent dehydrogenase (short-subunit alcohol dehydrogenase family)
MSRTVLITGCSTGFGFESALRFARAGDRVYATMRNVATKNAERTAKLKEIASSENLDIRVLELDVTSTESVHAAAKVVEAESGAVDVLINNAGVMYLGLTEAFTEAEYAHQLDVNVVGVHRVCRAFLPAMRAKKSGLVINVSSVGGRLVNPFCGIYFASKWAVEGYTGSLRIELASSGVDAVLVEPGPFATELFGQSPKPADAEGRMGSYPEAMPQVFDGMMANFDNLFKDQSAPIDPALVVDAFVNLANMNPGTRPLRTSVGIDFGVAGLNETTVAFDAAAAEAMGITELAVLKS